MAPLVYIMVSFSRGLRSLTVFWFHFLVLCSRLSCWLAVSRESTLTLAHAIHVWSASVSAFVSYPDTLHNSLVYCIVV